MISRRIFSATAAALVLSVLGPPAMAQDGPVNLIDFVIMQGDAGLQERDAYEASIAPVADRHGLRVVHSVDLVQHINGGIPEAVRLNVWEMPSPAAMQALMSDPDYVAGIPNRDAIHDMEALSLYLARELVDNGDLGGGMVLVDLVVMKAGYGTEAREAYEAKVAPIAARYGLELTASYAIDQKLSGAAADEPLRLNLWSIDDPAGLQKLNGDPDYKALEDERNALHDFGQLTLFMGTPNG